MLTFKDKAEEEFWKAVWWQSRSIGQYSDYNCNEQADFALVALRMRQPAQEFPVLDNKVI